MKVAPSRCVVIEDGATGVQAARAVGMTVLLPRRRPLLPGYEKGLVAAGATALFTEMQKLPALIGIKA